MSSWIICRTLAFFVLSVRREIAAPCAPGSGRPCFCFSTSKLQTSSLVCSPQRPETWEVGRPLPGGGTEVSQANRDVPLNAHRSMPLVGDEVPVWPGRRKRNIGAAWSGTAGGNGTTRGNGEAARLPGRGRHRWLLRRSILLR